MRVRNVIVVGVGEVGKPLLDLVQSVYDAEGVDLESRDDLAGYQADVMHICYPWTPAFLASTNEYINLYNPKLVLIESTVPPYTTQTVAKWNQTVPLCHSPVRGRRADGWRRSLKAYTKYIGPVLPEYGRAAARYYASLGLKTHVCTSPVDTEVMKLLSTSYYGVLIGWFQEVDRICREFSVNSRDVLAFLRSDQTESDGKHSRPIFVPGVIGGHCVIPNAEMLNHALQQYTGRTSGFLDALLASNKLRKEELDGKTART